MSQLSAIVLAGGIGSRFRSANPKVVHDFLGQPLVAWSLDAAVEAGANHCTMVYSPEIEAHLPAIQAANAHVSFALQPVKDGTGGAVRCALPDLDTDEGDVLVLCGDTPLLRGEVLAEFVAAHRAEDAAASVLTVVLEDAASYGRIVRDVHGRASDIVEFADATDAQKEIQEINTGVWVFDLAWLREEINMLDTDNAQGELYLTDLLRIAWDQQRSYAWAGGQPQDYQGINTRQEFARAWDLAQERILDHLQDQGVSLLGHGFRIEKGVLVGQDTRIFGPATLTGKTTIGNNVHIGEGAHIHDSTIGHDTKILPYCVLDDAHVGIQCHIGPYARLRPGANLAAGAKAGNFVEIKKSAIGAGSKINHLTYIGDATIGEGVNIGAGTITCNYDGVNKYQTEIGDGAFIGSNTSLVAPVKLGTRAITGAGSVITKAVEAEALAVERSQQREIKGYARRARKQAEKNT